MIKECSTCERSGPKKCIRFHCIKCDRQFGVNDYEENCVTCPGCGTNHIDNIEDRLQDDDASCYKPVIDKRYIITERSTSGHCCFVASVLDTTKPNEYSSDKYKAVCECCDLTNAVMIRDSLNGE